MNKSKTAGTHFNVRVVECRTAAKVKQFYDNFRAKNDGRSTDCDQPKMLVKRSYFHLACWSF